MGTPSRLSTSKLRDLIRRRIKKAVIKYNLIEQTDRILLAYSGGYDSLVLTCLINSPQFPWYNKVTIQPITVLGGLPDENNKAERSKRFLEKLGYNLIMLKRDIFKYAFGEDAPYSPCFICSRMRRKFLIEYAFQNGFNKIAFAHNKGDVIETFFLNLLYGRELSTFIPRLDILDGRLKLIRPMILASAGYIREYARKSGFPHLSYSCPYNDKSKRNIIREFLRGFEQKLPGVRRNIFNALTNPKYEYLWKS